MAFDFMKNFLMFEDEERFAKICESIEEAIREVNKEEEKYADSEIMQALDYVGFSLFRDDWEEFKKMEFTRDLNPNEQTKSRGKHLIH